MKGFINHSFQEMIKTIYGLDIWEKILGIINCSYLYFISLQDYPNEITHNLYTAAAQVLGSTTGEISHRHGKFFIQNTIKKIYFPFVRLFGKNAENALQNAAKINQWIHHDSKEMGPENITFQKHAEGHFSIFCEALPWMQEFLIGSIEEFFCLYEQNVCVNFKSGKAIYNDKYVLFEFDIQQR